MTKPSKSGANMQTHNNSNKCPICLDILYGTTEKTKQFIGRLKPCRHEYHYDCLNSWITISEQRKPFQETHNLKFQCPYCRVESHALQKLKYDVIRCTTSGKQGSISNIRCKEEKILKFQYIWELISGETAVHPELGTPVNYKSGKERALLSKFTRDFYLQNTERDRKKKINLLVREILDPLFHSPNRTIDKGQYTEINKKVSRQLYSLTENYDLFARKLCEKELKLL